MAKKKRPADANTRWTVPKTLGEFAVVYGVTARTFSRWLNSGAITHRRLSVQYVQIAVHELPAGFISLYGGPSADNNGQARTHSQ